jgi:hypothetical protein
VCLDSAKISDQSLKRLPTATQALSREEEGNLQRLELQLAENMTNIARRSTQKLSVIGAEPDYEAVVQFIEFPDILACESNARYKVRFLNLGVGVTKVGRLNSRFITTRICNRLSSICLQSSYDQL